MCNAWCRPDEGIHAFQDWADVPADIVRQRDLGEHKVVHRTHHITDNHGCIEVGLIIECLDVQPAYEVSTLPPDSDYIYPILTTFRVVHRVQETVHGNS